MSDDWMIVLSVDPLAVPAKERAEAAFEVLRTLRPKADEHELHLSDTPQFFDCGGNYETVFCPFCETNIGDWALEASAHGGSAPIGVIFPQRRRAAVARRHSTTLIVSGPKGSLASASSS